MRQPDFDPLSRGRDGEEVCIAVDGRAIRGGVNLQVNEWKQVFCRTDDYGICAVFDCDTPKQTLKRLRNLFRVLTAARYDSGVFAIPVSEPVEKVGRD